MHLDCIQLDLGVTENGHTPAERVFFHFHSLSSEIHWVIIPLPMSVSTKHNSDLLHTCTAEQNESSRTSTSDTINLLSIP